MKISSLSSGSALVGFSALALSATIASAATFPRFDGYRSEADSPAVAAGLAGVLVVDKFETPNRALGLTVSSGTVVTANSVDFDDSSLDGAGATGKSLFLGAWFPFQAPNSTLNFDPAELGAPPRFAGVVVTNASGVENPDGSPALIPVILTVYMTDGTSMQQVFNVLSNENDASDDVFIGVDLGADATIGIDSINISATTPIQIDHIQYTGVAAFGPQFVKDDHDGDGRSDVAWFYEPGRKAAIWNVLAGAVSGGYTSIDPGSADAELVGTGDVDADGKADMLWYNKSTKRYTIWQQNGQNSVATEIVRYVGNDWIPVAFTDINGDRKADCVFRRTSDGKTDIAVWLMDGTSIASGVLTSFNAPYTAAYVGNFDSDAAGELILRKGGSAIDAGALFIAQFDGATPSTPARMLNGSGSQEPILSSSIKIEGAADTDADGIDDLIVRGNDTISRWKIGASAVQAKTAIFLGTGAYWTIVGFPDFDGDRRRGVLFRGSGGETWSWELNGATIVRSGPLNTVDPNWKIATKQN
ncbi:MAG: hypothetical protein RLY21_1475 [Planctomycetota bacterium]